MNADVTTILNPLRANIEKHPDKLLYAFLDIMGGPRSPIRMKRLCREQPTSRPTSIACTLSSPVSGCS